MSIEEVKNILNDYLGLGIINKENFKEVISEVFGEFNTTESFVFDSTKKYSFESCKYTCFERNSYSFTNSKNEILFIVEKVVYNRFYKYKSNSVYGSFFYGGRSLYDDYIFL